MTADRNALDAGYVNALKHAEAASTLYSMLRFASVSAQTSERRGPSEQLVALARAGVLLRSEDGVDLSPEETRRAKQTTDIDWATSWFDQNKVAIEKRAMQALLDTRS